MSQGSKRDVYVFGTCLIDVLYPDAGMDTVHLLEYFGCQVHFPQDQTCCGQPAFNSGFRREALKVAEIQLALFTEPWPIVVPSGSCASMFRHDYPALFAEHPLATQAKDVASRVVELTAFLLTLTEGYASPPKETDATVVAHTSCSARRGLGQGSLALALIRRLSGKPATEPEEAEACCGFGGTFAVKQPELSAAMTASKCHALQATGAAHLVSGDCGCLMSLNGYLEQSGAALKGEHIASFLWRELQNRTARKGVSG